jgi:hypothetical protein
MTRTTTLPQSESSLQAAVIKLAKLNGWACYHTYSSRRSEPGFPDLIAVRPPRIIAAELKAAKGRISAEQRGWLDLLSAVPGVEVFVWRPDCWAEAERVLAR